MSSISHSAVCKIRHDIVGNMRQVQCYQCYAIDESCYEVIREHKLSHVYGMAHTEKSSFLLR